ncbi:hypothetical protein GALL_48040 [mine drainage metagenome]|uniref:Outer membrane protein beta-barrel domain-containing protein n=1 Tax=mine drainage metagenome TaxID=410659 RepID=A0A1J5TKV1_9ZZZZ
MQEKVFDNFIRSKLENYSSPVPDGLWEKIVRDKDRRPKGFWWINKYGLLTVIAVIILIAVSLFYVTNQKQNNVKNNTNSTLNTNQVSTEQKNNASVNNNSTADINKSNQTETTDSEMNPTQNSVTSSSRKNDNANITTGFMINRRKNGLFSFLQNKNQKVNSEPVQTSNPENESSLFSQNEWDNFSSVKNANGELMLLNKNVYSLNSLHNPPLNLRSIFGLGNDCPSANGDQRNDWYLQLYASPDYTMKSLSGNGLSNAYIQKKDSAEKMLGGFTIGAKLSKNVGDHFMLNAGIQYSQLIEKFNLSTVNETRTTVVIVSRTVIRPQGDTTFNDTTTVTQIGYAVRKNLNSYKNIEIPLGIGYEFGEVKDKWKVAVNGGVIINVTSWYNGETLDTSYRVVSVASKGNGGFYKSSTGLSLYGSISLIRNINDKLDVFAEPYFRVGLTPISSSIGYSQKFNAAGLTLGVRMKLNNKKQHL